jgi:hypothetical protein
MQPLVLLLRRWVSLLLLPPLSLTYVLLPLLLVARGVPAVAA